MILGQINKLKVDRIKSPGAYLTDIHGNEVLLPKKYLEPISAFEEGKYTDVFVMKDSQNRLVSTTEIPHLYLNEYAFLDVVQVNAFGAFVDWGLDKDLFVPFKEQKHRLEVGEQCLIQLKYDDKTDRLFGSEKIERSFMPCQESIEGEKVEGLVWKETKLGFSIIIENKYLGLLFHNRISKKVNIGDKISVFISKVREDGKLDLQLESLGVEKFDDAYFKILKILQEKGIIELGDKSSPEAIKMNLGLSKKMYKQAIGKLYKKGLVNLFPTKIELIKK